MLAEQGLYVDELTPVRADLESVFLELTAEEHLGATTDCTRRDVTASSRVSRPTPPSPREENNGPADPG